jgi:ATP-binding cassette subfamily B protein/subfamily B ATP-binding cassette protein MsbA
MPIVQAFVQEPRELDQFKREAVEAIRAQQQTVLLSSLGGFGSGLVTTLGTGVILWVGARYVLAGQMTIGGLWLFLRCLTTLQTHVKTLAAVYPAAQSFRARVDRIIDTLEAVPEVPERVEARVLPNLKGRVCFDSVTFGYEPEQPILRGISLDVAPGSVTAIIGSTGTGKSTLASLIPRFSDPWSGRVMLDGVDVRDLPVKWLRSQVAMVLQEPYLFSWSVADNIAYGRPGATRSEIEAAAKAGNAHEFIQRLPQGYDTILGERGGTLSGGERQRISISRAILKDAPILILDEPTSALDVKTEGTVMEALERLLKGRTTFLIAHRLSTIRHAQQILVLKDGGICEHGDHDTLMRLNGEYARFYRLQQQGDLCGEAKS